MNRLFIILLAFVLAVVGPTTGAISSTAGMEITQPGISSVTQPGFPIRAAFYYPWFPQSWNQSGINPFTHYHPTLGFYSQDDPAVIQQQVNAMKYGKIQAGIASWWGQGQPTDVRIPSLLQAGETLNFVWSLYIESEGYGDPSVDAIRSDLVYIRDHYATSPAFLKVDGKFVVFVYADPNDGCGMADRWKQANTVGAYVVLKVFPGFRSCANQPDNWHQYAPVLPQTQQDTYSFTISPGFWKANDSNPALARDLTRWSQNVRAMAASQADFQLISTFNEWGEGTSVESAQEWGSLSGYGLFLDALHYDGNIPSVQHPYLTYLPLTGVGAGLPPATPTPTKAPTQAATPMPTATLKPSATPTIATPPGTAPVLIGAGDIADCGLSGVTATAQLLAGFPDATIFTAGDNTYPDGKPAEFQNCFDPTWGQFKSRIHPASGNHEYHTANAAGYYGYYGAAAGDPTKGYYSYDLGDWHIVVLNSNCDEVGGCNAGSQQEQWLKADLAANPALCTLAYWHHPRFSSGEHGNSTGVSGLWTDLYAAGADLVVNGHDHDYERFAPQDPDGKADPTNGIREIVVGTGGGGLRSVSTPYEPNSEKVITQTFGVLKLVLQSDRYTWEFLPVAGKTATDSGTGICH